MQALSLASFTENLHVVDLPYRFSSWAMDDPGNLALWENTRGEPLAWAALQKPWGAVDYALHPAAGPELHRQVLAWADRRARQILDTPYGSPCWFVNVFPDQAERIHDLEAAGFACQADVGENSWTKVFMERPVELRVEGSRLPAGFSLRPLAREAEVQAYVDLHRAAFGSNAMTVAWRRRTLRRPEYRPELDLVAVAPDGQLAAFCVGWLAQHPDGSLTGQIEPLGVHPDFRGLGLGKAILAAAVRRMAAQGAGRVVVETDNYRGPALALYQSGGFHMTREVWVYRKDYA